MNVNLTKHQQTLICQCNSPEHLLMFLYDEDNDYLWDDVFCEVHLKPLPLWDRIKNGIKYIFGHRSSYGDFDEFIFKPEDWWKVQDIADHLKKMYERDKDNDGN